MSNKKKTVKKAKVDLTELIRFTKLEDKQEFKLTKIGSKRPNSMVGVGMSESGDFSLMEIPLPDQPDAVAAFIRGRGFSYLRTSPIVKVTVATPKSTTFETEGGIYKLEKYPPSRPEPKACPKCKTVSSIKDMDMKMGGLLCPKCNVILYQPYVDEEYFYERIRRAREPQAVGTEENSSGDGQEST